MRATLLASALIAALAATSLGANEASTVSATDLASEKTIVVGQLGHKVGTYVTIEAKYLGQPSKTGPSGLEITKIDGAAVKKETVMREVFSLRAQMQMLEKGTTYILRGYESIAAVGVPDDPLNPPSKDELSRQAMVGKRRLAIESIFVVTKAEEAGASR